MALPTIGNLFMAFGLLSAVVSVVALTWGHRAGESEGESLTNIGYLSTFAAAVFLTLSSSTLVTAFFREDFSFQYVVEQHTTDVSSLAWLYKLAGWWAGREGSLLFWAWLIALFAAWVAFKRMGITDRLSNVALAATNVVQVAFLAALFIENNNPFKVTPPDWLNPATGELLVPYAMNPLLQHWAMILHPPTLFVGYAGLTIPFAFAMAALITKDASKRWVELCDRITVFSWLFLGIGIGLGSIWAYVVLGWGGYWAWDPVENASLLPWLTGVGLLHSFTVYRRRNAFKGWAISMATFSLFFVILGTFITRSGVIQSVHAFEKDPLSLGYFLAMMIGVLIAGLGGLFLRWETFRSEDEFDSLLSKEASYYFNNVIMLVSALVVAFLTLSPAFGLREYGPATYDALAHPIGILYVGIMAICPILSWRKTEGPAFWSRAKWPLGGAAALAVPLLAIWWFELWPNRFKGSVKVLPFEQAIYGPETVIGLLVGALAISLPIYLFIDGARKRAAAKNEGFGTAFLAILTKARTQSGGYITHLGIGIILVGLIGSAMFVNDVKATVAEKPGEKFEAGGYTFTFKSVDQQTLPNGDVDTRLLFDVSRDGRVIGTVNPGQLRFARQGQVRLEAAVISEFLHDIFVVFEQASEEGLAMNVKINPLISWAWFGFALTIIGTVLAMWPKRAAAA